MSQQPANPIVEQQNQTQTAPVTETPSTPGGSGSSPGYTTSTTVNSMADLRVKAPKIYHAMLEGIAIEMINQMQDANERLKKIEREARENEQ